MSETNSVEGELPRFRVMPQGPLRIRRSEEYLEKVDVAAGAIYLLSRHLEYEMSRIELRGGASLLVEPRVAAHQSFYGLTGELLCLTRGERIVQGSSYRLDGDTEPLVFEALCRTSLLYFSTARDFYTLGGGLEQL